MLFRPVVGSHEAVHERYVKEKMNLLTLIRSVFAWKVKTFAGSDKVRFLFFSFVSQAPCIDSWVDSLLSFFGSMGGFLRMDGKVARWGALIAVVGFFVYCSR